MASPLVLKYKDLTKKFFPTGWAWRGKKGGVFDQLLESIAGEPARVEDRIIHFIDEMDPNRTFELLETWERLLGIPDECTPANSNPSTYERRVRIIQKLSTGGGQSPAFYQLIASQFGYDANIIDVINYQPFRVGYARVGQPLSNTAAWAFTFTVQAPAALVRYFRTGQSSVGERLVLLENETLECVIRKFAPAHVTVLFSFGA